MSKYFECDSSDLRYDGAEGVVKHEEEHLKAWRGRVPQNGIALSGGGIRSASYCLGVLQALAHEEWLPSFDYLSTVSGGGYIGASLTYLLNQPDGPAQGAPRFDTSKEKFPYLSYPMVGAATSTRDAERWKGRLLRRLRQNTRYLAPGDGINLLSLAGVFLRSCLAGVLVYAALTALLLEVLLWKQFLPKAQDKFTLGWPGFPADNPALLLGGLLFLAYLCVSFAYAFVTTFIDPIEGWWSVGPYRLRRVIDILTYVLLAAALIYTVVGLTPVVHHAILTGSWLTAFKSGSQFAKDVSDNVAIVTGAASAIVGALGMAWGYVQIGSAGKSKVPPSIVVPVASFLLLAGVVMIVYDVLIATNVRSLGSLTIIVASLSVLLLFGWLPDLNYLSLHRYYRDRLMELFMPDPARVWASVQDEAAQGRNERIYESVPADTTLLGKLCGADPATTSGNDENRSEPSAMDKLRRGPYHLLNANVVLVASRHPRYRARGGDNYILSPLYSGSRATGWIRTDCTPQNGFTLATAMAASGAAVSPNAACAGEGITRNPVVSVLMGLFNVRLGYWSRNPYWRGRVFESRYPSIVVKPNPIYPGLFESLGRSNLHEQARYVLLSDGGHFENLGLYELVRRRLKLIVVCDVSWDPKSKFSDLANAIEKVRADFGAIIKIKSEQLAALDPQPVSGQEDGSALSKSGYFVADIFYATREQGAVEAAEEGTGEMGKLVYLKPAVFKELPADLLAYRRAHSEFPHESTGDQFYDERRFEAYRELGFQTALEMLHSENVRAQLGSACLPPHTHPRPRPEPLAARVAAFVTIID